MSTIKNIIFDLGGVIINLDTPRTLHEFNKLSASVAFESIYTQLNQTPLFDDFDKGHISEHDFFETLQKELQSHTPVHKLVDAWNAMLLDFPIHRLNMLRELKNDYRLFLLSNTNETHVRAFENILLQSHQIPNLEPFFEKVYYSCRMGMRKPDSEIFEFVLNENGLQASETLFIDDTQKHVNGATGCGIRARLLPQGTDITGALPLWI
ncbi:MAG: HAD family phosphatase [Bacteroidetes bacterium]|nr:HAD family phosphatase [Bacteroidota bacterium]